MKTKICCRDDCDKKISWRGGYYFGYLGKMRCHCSHRCSSKTMREGESKLKAKRAKMLQPALFEVRQE